MDTKLCNEGGATCDEGTDLGLSFGTSSVAYAKCQLGEQRNNLWFPKCQFDSNVEIMELLLKWFLELTCNGITYDPTTEMWSLKTSETKSESASKHISYYKSCVESKTVEGEGSGMYNKKTLKIVYFLILRSFYLVITFLKH